MRVLIFVPMMLWGAITNAQEWGQNFEKAREREQAEAQQQRWDRAQNYNVNYLRKIRRYVPKVGVVDQSTLVCATGFDDKDFFHSLDRHM